MSGRKSLLAGSSPQALSQELGIPIFAVTANKARHTGTHGHLDATTDARQIAEWEQQWPGTMWAMATGRVTLIGRIGVIDIDRKVLEDGRIIWGVDALDEALISTPAQPEAKICRNMMQPLPPSKI
jgi:hypothetical protein